MTTSASNVTDSSNEGWGLGFSLTLWIDLPSLRLSFFPFHGTIVSPEPVDRGTPCRVCAATLNQFSSPILLRLSPGVGFPGNIKLMRCFTFRPHRVICSNCPTAPERWFQNTDLNMSLSAKCSPESLCSLHIKCGFFRCFQSSSAHNLCHLQTFVSNKYLKF